ncbi:dTDP-4-dehydrorhamnose reductase [Erythrobacter sp. YT30]|uniref:dTDP-4-dehydrorhamnose reductase n=1 Tax=Erythrobacter sp. YT30 TaxID=1735012 RepID=UPI00076BC134|nr:dTDP-4-dehydrorhamnose reductase [Erythrobacter sp. YT30]KWV91353.1 dTDP-4-dehydrorhamnose reductase [Erythrobacter sp. YT30]
MRVLITGATGQLGGALLAAAPAGCDVTAISSVDVDLADSAMLRARLAVEAPALIINAAAYTAVDKAENDEQEAYDVNAKAVGIMAHAMAETGGKLVHVSTDFVFDGEANTPYLPDAKRDPLSAYGRTKAAGENHLRPEDLLIRTSWVYEAGGSNFVRTMLRLMREREELGVVADQIGAPTWATRLAQVIWQLVDRKAAGIHHYCDDGQTSWYEFAVAIAEEAHALGMIPRIPKIKPIATTDYSTPAARPSFSVLDCSSTHAILGEPPVPWRDNLKAMLASEAASIQ